ncbi:MAG TPA: hypothetical protein V6C81_08090 [Planktothrix sp.]|jgi:hypothetical protein
MSEKEKDNATVASATKRPTMKKMVETKEDGRLIVYYSFAAESKDDMKKETR